MGGGHRCTPHSMYTHTYTYINHTHIGVHLSRRTYTYISIFALLNLRNSTSWMLLSPPMTSHYVDSAGSRGVTRCLSNLISGNMCWIHPPNTESSSANAVAMFLTQQSALCKGTEQHVTGEENKERSLGTLHIGSLFFIET